ncbi:hypothetical protein KCH_78000 [Kitasatospora cheerisanensis KCTC 2395]|uniref:Uncharacterized protein n=1 Tax=Kitasatospora cheerisanensis KCTC 2395 TaxID=1348663 RepID=A0A066YG20_9ACTN|nr:hypothetical protein KCH_78000 [Kitasatospora cheerisanensis KCTC 2395]
MSSGSTGGEEGRGAGAGRATSTTSGEFLLATATRPPAAHDQETLTILPARRPDEQRRRPGRRAGRQAEDAAAKALAASALAKQAAEKAAAETKAAQGDARRPPTPLRKAADAAERAREGRRTASEAAARPTSLPAGRRRRRDAPRFGGRRQCGSPGPGRRCQGRRQRR